MSKPSFSIEQRVYYEDTDALGIVYHANYLRFMERARSEWLWSLGFCFDDYATQDIGFAVHHIDINYRHPARLKDKLLITCSVHSHRNSSVTFNQSVQNADNTDIIYSDATIRLVCITLDGKLQPLPTDFLETIT